MEGAWEIGRGRAGVGLGLLRTSVQVPLYYPSHHSRPLGSPTRTAVERIHESKTSGRVPVRKGFAPTPTPGHASPPLILTANAH
jgi:hypothetical protein